MRMSFDIDWGELISRSSWSNLREWHPVTCRKSARTLREKIRSSNFYCAMLLLGHSSVRVKAVMFFEQQDRPVCRFEASSSTLYTLYVADTHIDILSGTRGLTIEATCTAASVNWLSRQSVHSRRSLCGGKYKWIIPNFLTDSDYV